MLKVDITSTLAVALVFTTILHFTIIRLVFLDISYYLLYKIANG